jgi:multiple sugar transport system permease protein
MSIFFSLANVKIGTFHEYNFVGLDNYKMLLGDRIFLQTVRNTFLFTISAVGCKLLIGIYLANLLKRPFLGNRAISSILLLPWVAPTALTTLVWLWIFDPLYSIFNWCLVKLGILQSGISWLGDPKWAMLSVILVNIWRGFPFFTILILAGLIGIPQELYEAADIDGANWWKKLISITLPMIKIVLVIIVLYSMVFTFSEFTTVQILTRGGPLNTTHLFSTLAYQRGILGGNISESAAISLFIFPVLLIVAIGSLQFTWKEREL